MKKGLLGGRCSVLLHGQRGERSAAARSRILVRGDAGPCSLCWTLNEPNHPTWTEESLLDVNNFPTIHPVLFTAPAGVPLCLPHFSRVHAATTHPAARARNHWCVYRGPPPPRLLPFFFPFFFPPVGLSLLPKLAPPAAVLDAETRTAAKHFGRGYRFLTMEHNSKAQWTWSHILVQFISSPRVDHGQALLSSLGELHMCVIFGAIRQCIRYLLP